MVVVSSALCVVTRKAQNIEKALVLQSMLQMMAEGHCVNLIVKKRGGGRRDGERGLF